ncbi:MAG: Smr/MutS family protein [Pseudomonadota bacterium]
MARRKKGLSEEDRRLWSKVTETVTPMAMAKPEFDLRAMPAGKLAEVPFRESLKKPQNPAKTLKSGASPMAVQPASVPRLMKNIPLAQKAKAVLRDLDPIDRKTVRKIAKGRIEVDGRLDLHGMTQDQALTALRRFLLLSREADHRVVLIITGKGSGKGGEGSGVLKRRVPDWLRLGELAPLVSGIEWAGARHGGEGALYVRLKRRGARQKQ